VYGEINSKEGNQKGTLEKEIMDWAYIAGLIECDGSIVLSKHTCKTNNGYRPSINFVNISKTLIDVLKEELPGGCVITPTGKSWRRIVWDDYYNVQGILLNILPYLVYKKEQAELLIEFIDIRQGLPSTRDEKGRFASHHSHREKEIFERIKELHQEREYNS